MSEWNKDKNGDWSDKWNEAKVDATELIFDNNGCCGGVSIPPHVAADLLSQLGWTVTAPQAKQDCGWQDAPNTRVCGCGTRVSIGLMCPKCSGIKP